MMGNFADGDRFFFWDALYLFLGTMALQVSMDNTVSHDKVGMCSVQ